MLLTQRINYHIFTALSPPAARCGQSAPCRNQKSVNLSVSKRFSSYWIRSALYSFMQRFSVTLFGVINFVILTRLLSAFQLGTWALFLTITGIFESTKSNLLKNAHIRYVGTVSGNQGQEIRIASSSLLINSSISILFILLVVCFSEWVGYWFNTGTDLGTMLNWFIPGLILMIFFGHLEAIQQSFLDFKGVFVGYFLRQLVFFGILVYHYFAKEPLTLIKLVNYQTISIAAGLVPLFLLSRRYLQFRFRPQVAWIKKLFGYGGYIFGSGMVANLCINLDQMMIARYVNPESVAPYNVASRINLLVDIPSYAASEIIFPKASRASVEEGPEKVRYLFERMVAILLAFTIPAAILVILFAKLITLVIAGRAYLVAIPILQLYMITGIFRPAQNQAANLLNSIGKPRLTFLLNTGFLLILVVLNYLFIHLYGFYGAAIGNLSASMVFFAGWYFVMRKQINLQPGNIFRYIRQTYRGLWSTAVVLITKRKLQNPFSSDLFK